MRLGLSTVTVARERMKRGIPPFVPAQVAFDWTPQRLALPGTATDAAVAASLGIGGATVVLKRRRSGIPATQESRSVADSPGLREVLELPTAVVRQRTGLAAGTIKKPAGQSATHQSERGLAGQPLSGF